LAFALRPSGEQALANVLHVSELARKYEASGGLSFRGFVETLQEGSDAAETGEAPVFEEGGEGIRIMSVHKAKGLEFPVVILADITAKLSSSYPSRHIDAPGRMCAIPLAGCEPRELQENAALELARDRAEGVRVAYVASTRARDLLVVPTIGDHPFGKWDSIENWWVRPLYTAVYPPVEQYRKPEQASACPKFGKDSVLSRPDNAVAEEDNVCPGRYSFESNGEGYEVTWWDPKVFNLDIRQSFGIRQEELLAVADPEVAKRDLEIYRDWRTKAIKIRDESMIPSLVIRTATHEARKQAGGADVTLVELPRGTERPVGTRFGVLVHATLATVALDATPELIRNTAVLQGRILGAPGEEIEAASAAAQATLAHPLLQRAREAWMRGQCRRETPLTLTLSDGTLVEGVVDLAFFENNTWTVLDFKTDRELNSELANYEKQVSLYASAISRSTGYPTSAVLVRI
jgi:ATP-dependent helicase/nuclease subunit A